MYKPLVPLFVAVSLSIGPLSAQEELPTPDIIGCFKALEQLDLRYRGWLQINCVERAFQICDAIADHTPTCLPELVTALRDFNIALIDRLPDEPEGLGWQIAGYKRHLDRAIEIQTAAPECVDLEGYEKMQCEFLQLSMVTRNHFHRARQTQTPLP